MAVRSSLRVTIPCVLILASVCALAGPKDKEPAPRFSATTTTGEKFNNETIKGKVVLLEFFTGSGDRKSTRLNSSHQIISYAVFCLKKKKNKKSIKINTQL